MAAKSKVKVVKSKTFTTPAFRAVFPNLNKPDQFGSYGVTCDALENPEIEKTIKAQIKEFLPYAQEKAEATKKPTNEFVRSGEWNKGDQKGQPFRLISFKMKAIRKGKDGEEIPQKPVVVDSKKQPMSKLVFGGSLVKVAYRLQYTITPTGCFMSVKLSGVQVLQLVSANGEATVDQMFDEEDGYVDSEDSSADTPASDNTNSDDDDDDDDEADSSVTNGSDF